ncbi:MAG TPA: RsmB/NOP family class I SAM-dependent RNA methyltransferase [Candidatus Thermoplasmatota archaeon]
MEVDFEPIRIPPTPALRRWSSQNGFAPELVARWGEFYPDLQGLLRAMAQAPQTWLRLNGLRAPPEDTLRRMRERGMILEDGPLPQAAKVVETEFSAGATPEYLSGRYFLQDLSSQLAPTALDPQPGERIADLSAAPGGKTVAIADMMGDDGVIAAFEIDRARHQALTSNLARCGVTSAVSWAKPGQSAKDLGEQFDAVLLDAPCTGEGVVSRDPRRRMGQLQEYESCAREQASLLETAAAITRPGGRIVYATCTLAPEENELQVERAVKELGLVVEDLPQQLRDVKVGGQALFPGIQKLGTRELIPDVSKTLHALPHLHGILGFYVARLRKEAS